MNRPDQRFGDSKDSISAREHEEAKLRGDPALFHMLRSQLSASLTLTPTHENPVDSVSVRNTGVWKRHKHALARSRVLPVSLCEQVVRNSKGSMLLDYAVVLKERVRCGTVPLAVREVELDEFGLPVGEASSGSGEASGGWFFSGGEGEDAGASTIGNNYAHRAAGPASFPDNPVSDAVDPTLSRAHPRQHKTTYNGMFVTDLDGPAEKVSMVSPERGAQMRKKDGANMRRGFEGVDPGDMWSKFSMYNGGRALDEEDNCGSAGGQSWVWREKGRSLENDIVVETNAVRLGDEGRFATHLALMAEATLGANKSTDFGPKKKDKGALSGVVAGLSVSHLPPLVNFGVTGFVICAGEDATTPLDLNIKNQQRGLLR